MLIAGWVSVGASDRGAFGFLNERSLMYWPTTLSCAWPGLSARALCGAAIAAGGRHRLYLSPFSATVVGAAFDPTLAPSLSGGVANTGAPAGQGLSGAAFEAPYTN